VHFFGEGQARSARTVRIETLRRGNTLRLTFADSGPGIRTLTVDEVWLPGRTTRELGTGLGLTIVRDIVRDLRGNVEARAKGELGGAEFVIELPCVATDAGAL
jgi:C4-dicarboxylate-specific signal transduction histidine kinase